ncbi:hypothetical protein Efla_004071 [Eimeria flavescens]
MARRLLERSVAIVGGARTPVGSFRGALHAVPSSQLAAAAAAAALQRAGAAPNEVNTCVIGQALSAGQGLSTHRQALLAAGLPSTLDLFRVEKGDASGLQAVCLSACSVSAQQAGLAVAVGVEACSSAPFLLQGGRAERVGDWLLRDSLLTDAPANSQTNNSHFGINADAAAARWGLTRAACDAFAVRSHRLTREAASSGLLQAEGLAAVSCSPVLLFLSAALHADNNHHHQQQQRGRSRPPAVLREDEALQQQQLLQLDAVAAARPSFGASGVTTAANACKPADGAAALVLATEEEANRQGLKPLGRWASPQGLLLQLLSPLVLPLLLLLLVLRILSFASAACEAASFVLAAEEACRKALRLAGLQTASNRFPLSMHGWVLCLSQADLFDVLEVSAAVPLLLQQRMQLCPSRLNVMGGALCVGHPFGMSGVRLLLSLLAALRARELTIGCAAACSVGGCATAMVIEAL